MSSDSCLLWLDLETSGSKLDYDEIIEVGVVLTDMDFNTWVEYDAVVSVPYANRVDVLSRIARTDAVYDMHSKNGLLREIMLGNGQPLSTIENDILILINESIGTDGRVFIAGSGVGHFDRKFVDRFMPALGKRLQYAPLDIGNIRRALKWWTGREFYPKEISKTHRSLDDVKVHIGEARLMRQFFLDCVTVLDEKNAG